MHLGLGWLPGRDMKHLNGVSDQQRVEDRFPHCHILEGVGETQGK